MFWDN